MLKSDDPTSSACTASPRAWVRTLNLDEKWAYNEIKLGRQLREIFDRTSARIPSSNSSAGLNNLWTRAA